MISLWHGIFLRYVKNGIILNETKGNNIIVRIGCIYSYDMDFNDYEEGERICIDKNASSVGFTILDNPDGDEALNGREGALSADFEYELHDGQLCAVIDGKYVPCEDDYEFEQRLRAMGVL